MAFDRQFLGPMTHEIVVDHWSATDGFGKRTYSTASTFNARIEFKKRIVKDEVVDRLDHKYVNDVIDNPTAEHMAVWIWGRLAGALPGLVEIELHETRSCSVVYRGE